MQDEKIRSPRTGATVHPSIPVTFRDFRRQLEEGFYFKADGIASLRIDTLSDYGPLLAEIARAQFGQ